MLFMYLIIIALIHWFGDPSEIVRQLNSMLGGADISGFFWFWIGFIISLIIDT